MSAKPESSGEVHKQEPKGVEARIMSEELGEYLKEGESLDIEKQANEILEFSIGTATYGEVRRTGIFYLCQLR